MVALHGIKGGMLPSKFLASEPVPSTNFEVNKSQVFQFVILLFLMDRV